MSRSGMTAAPEGAAFQLLHPVQVSLSVLLRPVTALVTRFNNGASAEELERLRDENARLQTEVAQLREIAAQYQELQQLLRIRADRPNDEYLQAAVRGRDVSGLHSAVAINRGSADGIREGMVVLAPSGALVGKVMRVSRTYSWVRLLDDPSTSITASVQATKADGVVTGKFGGQLAFSLVPQGTEVKSGDLVVTAGLGGSVPPAIPIGKVRSVSGSRQDLFKEIAIEPQADLTSLTQVLVLMNFIPDRVDRP
jgi:rod shape-determining protein MreC